jgi:hypothetical protein
LLPSFLDFKYRDVLTDKTLGRPLLRNFPMMSKTSGMYFLGTSRRLRHKVRSFGKILTKVDTNPSLSRGHF